MTEYGFEEGTDFTPNLESEIHGGQNQMDLSLFRKL